MEWALRARQRVRKALNIARAVRVARRNPAIAPLQLLDVGARGGLARKWHVLQRCGYVRPILVEPDSQEAERIRHNYPDANVIPFALGDYDGRGTLNITRVPGRSSLLRPDPCATQAFGEESEHVIERTLEIEVRRYDTLAVESPEAAPQPDFVKLDVQGYELNVLNGLGDILDAVLCIEVETYLVPLYVRQPNFQDVCTFLRTRGFGLVDYRPLGLSSGQINVANAFFCRTTGPNAPHAAAKISLWRELMGVTTHEAFVNRCN